MKWNLIRHELRQNRRGFFICLFIALLFIVLLLGKAEAFVNNPEMERLIQGLPEGLLKAFGIQAESLRTFDGYLATQVFPYFIVIVSSFAAAWAGGSIAREREQGTGEYLFALPYSRSSIFWSKAAAHFFYMTVVFLCGTGLLFLLAQTSGQEVRPADMLRLLLAGYLLVLSFMGISYGLTSWLASDRTAVSMGAGIAVLAFFLNMLSGSSELMEKISLISPYRLFDTLAIVKGDNITASGWILTLGLFAAGTAVGVLTLKRRDLC
ncbi:ABC transporter permease subunit [Paenibacillus dakarensis]|uniref:ABC transporter permease subunit n=1 Tax=Paenibacillus dakarensis TaxID=1527293 RepID=UPI0006D5AFB7|nr:ABC transporter permease subunit [Paenibacillus dakarensis]